MIVKRIKLHNWKNFQNCDISLTERTFVIGANASGKSNFIDALRFLRDVSKQAGGLQYAVEERGGITKIRCLAARTSTDVRIIVELGEPDSNEATWTYELGFSHTGGGIMKNQVRINQERVYSNEQKKYILNRTKESEEEDDETLKYTYLEQVSLNKEFRAIQSFFQGIEYLNIVPQFVRESSSAVHTRLKEDYYGRNFLERLANKNERVRNSYFRKINQFLKIAVPQLSELSFRKDEMGVPHLEARYEHWRAKGSKQQEEQFSDGTIRLIGFLFCLIDCNGLVLLEEPEINLHSGIVAKLPEFIASIQRTKKQAQQVIITTHSYEMLANDDIGTNEVLLLQGSKEGTTIAKVSDIEHVKAVVDAGFSMAEAVLPQTKPSNIDALSNLKFDF